MSRRADPLPENGRLSDPGVDDAVRAVLRLQALVDQVHVAEDADVLTEDDDARVACEVIVEAAQQDDTAVDGHRARCIARRHGAHAERRGVR